jgi:hypothetical protein
VLRLDISAVVGIGLDLSFSRLLIGFLFVHGNDSSEALLRLPKDNFHDL